MICLIIFTFKLKDFNLINKGFFYIQYNFFFRKPNLILEPKEKIGDIIMVVSSKPAFYINLKEGEKCTIIGIKLSHSGNSEDL